jgi:lipopolysaccharide transport system ATP-binding protein
MGQHGDLVLRAEDVAVTYRKNAGLFKPKKFWALKDVSFDLFHGETLGVIGGNGAGKSTLLRLLAGIIAPDKGRIIHDELNISLLGLNVGFISHLTGRNNAVLSGMLMGARREEIEAKLDDIIEFAEIGEFIDEPVRSYSSGMRARLGFSVAIQADPDILLIDETLGVGDARFARKSSKAMRQKIKSNKTIVLVSHSEKMVRRMCDRVVWIDKGVSRREGDTNSIMDEYMESMQ